MKQFLAFVLNHKLLENKSKVSLKLEHKSKVKLYNILCILRQANRRNGPMHVYIRSTHGPQLT